MKRLLARLALLALATAGSFGAAEAYARSRWPEDGALAPGTLDGRTESCARRHPTRGWSITGTCGRDERGLFIQPEAAPAGAWRLLVVGDSVAEEEWVAALARALEPAVGRPVELLNAATSGYNTCQEAVTLAELTRDLDPDAILLETCPNDSAGSAVVIPQGAWSAVAWNDAWRMVPTVLLRSRVVQLALVSQSAPSGEGHLGRSVRACASAAADTAERAGVPMVVVHFPMFIDADEVDGRFAGMRREEAEMVESWRPVDVPQVSGRAVLAARGSLREMATNDQDRIHPAHAEGAAIGRALAGPVAAALDLGARDVGGDAPAPAGP